MPQPDDPLETTSRGTDPIDHSMSPYAIFALSVAGLVAIAGFAVLRFMSDDGSSELKAFRQGVRKGMLYSDLVTAAERPRVRLVCNGPTTPAIPPCASLRFYSTGGFGAVWLFSVTLDKDGRLVEVGSIEYGD